MRKENFALQTSSIERQLQRQQMALALIFSRYTKGKLGERILVLLLALSAFVELPAGIASAELSASSDASANSAGDANQAAPANAEQTASAIAEDAAHSKDASEEPAIKIAANNDASSDGADPQSTADRIEELTRQILLKEIALEKFNLNYKLNAAKQGRWKGWRYAFFNEANAGMGIAGGIIGTQQRGSHLHRSEQVKNYIQQNANFIPMIGSIIAASAAILEFNINEFHEYQAYKKGFSPGKARDYVNNLNNEIKMLMTERDALVKLEAALPMLTHRCEVDTLEGKVMKDIRDLSLLEFQRFHLGARRTFAFQQSQYFFDLSKHTTNAIGLAFGYLALHRRRRPWNLRAGVLFNVSGALTMAGPIVSRLYAKSIHEYHKSYFLKDTIADAEAKECAVLEQDQKALEAMCQKQRDGSPASLARVDRGALYVERSKVFQDQVQKASSELDRAKLVATQNIGSGMYVGGSKLASGILFTIPGYFQLYNSKGQRAARVTNHLLFSSGVIGLQASSFSFLDTLRIQVTGELNRHKLAAKGALPAQLIKQRLEQLEALEVKWKNKQY